MIKVVPTCQITWHDKNKNESEKLKTASKNLGFQEVLDREVEKLNERKK